MDNIYQYDQFEVDSLVVYKDTYVNSKTGVISQFNGNGLRKTAKVIFNDGRCMNCALHNLKVIHASNTEEDPSIGDVPFIFTGNNTFETTTDNNNSNSNSINDITYEFTLPVPSNVDVNGDSENEVEETLEEENE